MCESNLLSLPTELIIPVLSNLSERDLYETCKASSRLYEICQFDSILKSRYAKVAKVFKANEIDSLGQNGLLRAISNFVGNLNLVYFEDLDYLYSDEYYRDAKDVLELVEITEDINVKNTFGQTALLLVLAEWAGHLNVRRNDAEDEMRRIAVAILRRDPDVTEEIVGALNILEKYGARCWEIKGGIIDSFYSQLSDDESQQNQ